MTFGARNIDRAPDVFTVKSVEWLGFMKKSEVKSEMVEMIERIRKHQKISYNRACWQIRNVVLEILLKHESN